MNVEEVKAFFTANGLRAEHAEKALKPTRFRMINGDTVIEPDEDFMFSLSPEERQKLYEPMIGMDVNRGISMGMSFPKAKWSRSTQTQGFTRTMWQFLKNWFIRVET